MGTSITGHHHRGTKQTRTGKLLVACLSALRQGSLPPSVPYLGIADFCQSLQSSSDVQPQRRWWAGARLGGRQTGFESRLCHLPAVMVENLYNLQAIPLSIVGMDMQSVRVRKGPSAKGSATGIAAVTCGQHRPSRDQIAGMPDADARTCLLTSVSFIRKGPP